MKKFLFSIIALFSILSCDSTIDDLKSEIAELEKKGQALDRQRDSLKTENSKQQRENDNTKERIDTTSQAILWKSNGVMLSYFEFLQVDNPYQLIEDVKCTVLGDSIICYVPNIMPNKVLTPHFSYVGTSLTIEGVNAESGVSSFDFKKPLKLTISSEVLSKDFYIYVYSYTGLPTLWVTTSYRQMIEFSNQKYQSQFKLVENASTRVPGDITEGIVSIMGVGKLAWEKSDGKTQMGRNDYRLFFGTSRSLLGEPSSTTWELLSNTNDPTLLRTQAGFHMGKISNLNFTPTFHYVDFMLNERYYGTYMLGDAIDYSKNRTDVGEDGFILKIDANITSNSFRADHIEQPVNVIYPTAFQSNNFLEVITNHIKEVDAVLFSSNFTDAKEGWQKYLDMNSFVDWYLINEIAKNEGGAFTSDCYMCVKSDGLIKMGPLWKMEKSFGYEGSSSSDFVIKKTKWFSRLFEDPVFVAKVKERFTYFFNHKKDILSEIEKDAYWLRYAALENSYRWKVFDESSSVSVDEQYKKQVVAMKSWLEKRLDWLNTEFSKM